MTSGMRPANVRFPCFYFPRSTGMGRDRGKHPETYIRLGANVGPESCPDLETAR